MRKILLAGVLAGGLAGVLLAGYLLPVAERGEGARSEPDGKVASAFDAIVSAEQAPPLLLVAGDRSKSFAWAERPDIEGKKVSFAAPEESRSPLTMVSFFSSSC